MKKSLLCGLLAVATSLSPWSIASAATAYCVGSVVTTGSHQDWLVIRLSTSNDLVVCGLSPAGQAGLASPMTPEGCRLAAATAAQAKAMNSTLTIIVDNAPTTDCLSMSDFFRGQVRYVMQR